MVHPGDLLVADLLVDTPQFVTPRATAVRVADTMEDHPAEDHPAEAHPAEARREGVPITAVVIPLMVRSVILTAAAVPAHRCTMAISKVLLRQFRWKADSVDIVRLCRAGLL